ncbi:metal-dependent hydrolase [Marinobacterium zhoushanense]|uniref:Metal-dependent hydrolase n=1 Tax=Marinobacterium zhoushanense TaxID=1679163 RepID=A0ABQ1KQZ8_9GAMM|nr:TatD family hydrolase [Marinobacterium zhoushanense]GGC08200.1 metal-dependent hydrolase [Marinobacterium zhoushanense]
MLIDTHCHLDFPIFDSWRDQALRQACIASIGAIVVPGVTARHWVRVLDLTCGNSSAVRLYPALGLHPCFMSEHRPEHLDQLRTTVVEHRDRLVAIGEIGLDFQLEHYDARAQTELLQAQLLIAREAALPVLLHVRKAHDQVLKLLRQLRLPRAGIVHAFSGSEQQAREYAKLGFKLGFGGAISYPRATKLRRLAAELPLEWLVLETDAPDMPLSRWRDEPNQPLRVVEVAHIIAELRATTVEQVAQQTSATARKLLQLNHS